MVDIKEDTWDILSYPSKISFHIQKDILSYPERISKTSQYVWKFWDILGYFGNLWISFWGELPDENSLHAKYLEMILVRT